jgi:hypothetical protein
VKKEENRIVYYKGKAEFGILILWPGNQDGPLSYCRTRVETEGFSLMGLLVSVKSVCIIRR